MKNLVIDETLAKELYPEAPNGLKTRLEKAFGKSLLTQKITDLVKTFDDVLKFKKINKKDFTAACKTDTSDEVAYKQLKMIAEVLNEGWKPDWSNEDEYKYYPWWNMEKGFVLLSVNCRFTGTTVGSRLCFRSEELAKHAATQFKSIYKEFLTLQ